MVIFATSGNICNDKLPKTHLQLDKIKKQFYKFPIASIQDEQNKYIFLKIFTENENSDQSNLLLHIRN